jgi:UDP-glucose-4-epimerase GalE
MRILVTGGAGYIGSHMVLRLAEAGHHPVVVDDLSAGHRDAVLAGEFHRLDIRDVDGLSALMRESGVEAVMHFAGLIEAGESVVRPLDFHACNVGGTIAVAEAMRRVGVDRLVFSSTAGVYGAIADGGPVDENSPLQPLTPYGRSKMMAEEILGDAFAAHGIRGVILRYFNAAGADPQGRLGERHKPETHLIPLALAAAAGLGPTLIVRGDDYPTPDGTCIRDYVHVHDLAVAHLAALDHLTAGGSTRRFNLGSGCGHSVREVIEAVERVTGRPVPHAIGSRRSGDPARLVACCRRAEAELGWRPEHAALDDMIRHAWAFLRA